LPQNSVMNHVDELKEDFKHMGYAMFHQEHQKSKKGKKKGLALKCVLSSLTKNSASSISCAQRSVVKGCEDLLSFISSRKYNESCVCLGTETNHSAVNGLKFEN